MFAHNTEEVIERYVYGEAVFHAVDDMDEQDFSMMDEVIQTSLKKIRSQTIHM